MVRLMSQVRVHQLLTCWAIFAAMRLGSYEYGADFLQYVWVVELERPSLLCGIINIKDSEIHR
jgi:hypothetical protein